MRSISFNMNFPQLLLKSKIFIIKFPKYILIYALKCVLHPQIPCKAAQDDISPKKNCSHLISSHCILVSVFNLSLPKLSRLQIRIYNQDDLAHDLLKIGKDLTYSYATISNATICLTIEIVGLAREMVEVSV